MQKDEATGLARAISAGLCTFETDFEQQFENAAEGSRKGPVLDRSSRTVEGAAQLLGLDFLIHQSGEEERIEESASVLDRGFWPRRPLASRGVLVRSVRVSAAAALESISTRLPVARTLLAIVAAAAAMWL